MEHLTRARPKRKRTSGTANGSSRAFHPPQTQLFPNAPSAAATEDDKKRWKGFCEIESEPAFFNVMLKDFGVRGVKIQEVFGLEDELVAFLS
ncbi:MAG: Ubiquitin carboxyl-terminal hydrolase bap1 [Pycnora praestabilis]|nr:MAG: Ubiquitin carboxyl-terminal hydrolase bap1 [Pycnora praestabilis]